MEWSVDRILGLSGLGLGVFAIVVGLAVTLAMDAKTRGEFRFAAGCFVFAALMLASTIGLWDVNTQSAMPNRIVIVALLFAVVGVSVVEAIRWSHGRHLRAAVSDPKPTSPFSPAPLSAPIIVTPEPAQPEPRRGQAKLKNPLEIVAFDSNQEVMIHNHSDSRIYVIDMRLDADVETKAMPFGIDIPPRDVKSVSFSGLAGHSIQKLAAYMEGSRPKGHANVSRMSWIFVLRP